ncbi:inter-alpha-trypsin inhibitor heavy chain H3-like [Alosa pseudoharengus]|uniref:inter-alpha-trypsin inhibitor heavy chain H3-like n=1 Tax=Alosa pseudoharengus TaxID=34774 RepID=UPI003F8B0726
MTTKALNKGNSSKEIFFEVELPKTAFITNFSMEIEGKTYVGAVKEKEKAKKEYEKAVSSGQTAGLVKASGRKMEKFSVSVNIAALSPVIFTLTYEELLKRHLGKYEIMTRVKPKQLVQHFEIADIYEPQGIAFLDVYGTFLTNELLPLVEKTVTDKKAHVSFSPTLDQQRKCPDCDGTLIDGDFFIKYDVNRAESIGDIQSLASSEGGGTSRVQHNVRNAINGSFSLFSLGFGYDLDYGFLDSMAKENDGLARRIYEASDAAVQLQGFYDEVASPLLSDVHFKYPDNAVNSLTNSHFKQLFNGSEIIVAGQLTEYDLHNFLIEVSGKGVSWMTICYRAKQLPRSGMIHSQRRNTSLGTSQNVEQLMEKKDKGSPEERANATAEALDLSLKYSFVTPLTSMVVTKPENEENPYDVMIADKLTEEQRGRPQDQDIRRVQYHHPAPPTYYVDGDPHFIIEVPEMNDALCFNIDERPGTIFNLVSDPVLGIVVNGQTIGDKKVDPGSKLNTYFGRFGIVHQTLGIQLVVSTDGITVFLNKKTTQFDWSETILAKNEIMDLQITKDSSLTVTLKDSVKFVIILHKVWKKHPYHQDYLGFYTIDSHLLSPRVHGLLGQFYHGVQFEVSNLHPGEDPEKPDATMDVKGHKLTVTRGWQRDFRRDVKNGEKVPCWFVHNNGTGLIDGSHEDYVMSSLF